MALLPKIARAIAARLVSAGKKLTRRVLLALMREEVPGGGCRFSFGRGGFWPRETAHPMHSPARSRRAVQHCARYRGLFRISRRHSLG